MILTLPAGARLPIAQGVSQEPPDQVPANPDTPGGAGSSTVTARATEGPALEMITVQLTDVPATTGWTGPVLVIDRSASVVTSEVAVAESSPEPGSDCAVSVVAVTPLTMVAAEVSRIHGRRDCDGDRRAARVEVGEATADRRPGRGSVGQVTPVGGVRWMSLIPAGRSSETVTPRAVDGPVLLSWIVQLIGSPATTAVGPVLCTTRWARVSTGTREVAVLLPWTGSGTAEVTFAVLVIAWAVRSGSTARTRSRKRRHWAR